MRAVGIIAEYNPLHNGHIYHIEEAKKLAGCDAVVVAVSGDYVQRGEPAILDKWERTEMALLNGADLVVEIPALFCLGNAAQYGGAGVKLLEAIPSVTHLAFGSEIGNVEILKHIADNMDKNKSPIENRISELAKKGISYPRARSVAYAESFDSDEENALNASNDILALEYIRACSRLEPIAIKRIGAGYNDMIDEDMEYQSAGGLRAALKANRDISRYVPFSVSTAISGSTVTFSDDWMNMLRYAVLSMSADEIDDCPSGGEGLGNRIKKKIEYAASWTEFVEAVKSKRYTHTRISRLCMQIILRINRKDIKSYEPQYLRVLGLTSNGRTLLSEIDKDNAKLPIINNVNKQRENLSEEGCNQLELDIHAADIYNLVTGRDLMTGSDYRMHPIVIESGQ